MPPTPSPHSSYQSHFRFRRPRNANPYDPSHNITSTAQVPVTPLPDEGADEGELEDEDLDVDDEEGDIDGDGGSNVDEEGQDAEDEEGGIEEGSRSDWGSPAVVIGGRAANARPFMLSAGQENSVYWFPQFLAQTAHWRLRNTVPMDLDAPFDPTALGLKEIGNLASWTVSSCKPGCGVEALRDDDVGLFWQSDGPQPHHLNIHFSRLVSIRSIRIYLDFESDESYTPTRITLLAGTGYHDLIPFSALEFTQPKGWIDVPLDDVGGGEDGKTLRAFLVQVRIVENHQNGKDTHVRGLKVYARDEKVRGGISGLDTLGGLGEKTRKKKKASEDGEAFEGAERGWLTEPDWMGEPELR